MVGKARRARLHSAAPRPHAAPPPPGPGPGPDTGGCGADKDWDFSSSGVFAGLKIDPDTLVKKLDLDSRSIISSRTEVPMGEHSLSREGRHFSERQGGLEEKKVLSKKEKMKLRRERWLQKIENVKLAKQKQKAEAKRKATPVVGDLQPLMEALPELSDLTSAGRGRKPPKSHVKAKAEPADFCLMKQAQKRRLLEEEVARFHEVITNPSYRANPLMAISEHLSKRLRQEEEGKPL
ncbi:ribosome biogenesis protein SLX9 homolog isoform X1 [Cuculus canorus]|uniref:ribosome biogenesis protein SLX9 homolog isoform X1 n=1 Tax=Cuculus canorus TaxID=55661 RepID=UPI0023AB4ABE|nr:ribosome biogenesis protein SLX9 homolog isoform X1 [Cuculus canorus]